MFMKRGRRLNLFIAAAALLCAAMPSFSQQGGQPHLESLIKPFGWEIPHLESLVVVSRTPLKTEDGTKVHRSVLRMKAKNSSILFEDMDFYEFDESGKSLTIRTNSLMADEIIRYDVAGKSFAYTFVGTCVSLGRETKRGREFIYMGCKTMMAFYDEDGDGIFETRNSRLNPVAPGRESVPAWVKKPAKEVPAAAKRD